MAELPTVIIYQILSNLPVKSLIRFRSVSKQWLSWIKDPHFIKLHLNNSIKNKTNQTLIIRDSYLHSLDFPKLSKLSLVDHPLKSPRYGTELFGFCNGVLCLSNGDGEGVDGTILYNPATREHHELPASEIEFPVPERFTWCDRTVYGFGYDNVNDDYKVVRVIQFDGRDEFDSEVKIYSLKLCSWKRISDFPREFYLLHKRCWGVYVNGCLHWVVSRKPESDGTKLILAFDVGFEEYKVVSQPVYSNGEFHMNVGVLNGCLSVLSNYHGVKSDIWVMEEYGVEKSWVKLFSIAYQGVVDPFYEYVRPIAYSDDGLSVLVEKDGKSLFWFDLETQRVKNVTVSGLPPVPEAELIVESLVPLECYQKKDNKSKPKKEQKPKRKEKKSKPKRDDDMDGFLSKGFKLKL